MSDIQKRDTVRERLINYATTILYSKPNMQAFFTTCKYFFNLPSAMQILTLREYNKIVLPTFLAGRIL